MKFWLWISVAWLAAPPVHAELPSKRSQLPIPWLEAGKHIGKTVTVSGSIVATYRTKKLCLLHFHKDHKDYFTVAVYSKDFSKFPKDFQDHYNGKDVLVTGTIVRKEGRPMMVVRRREQIWVVGESLKAPNKI